MRMPCNVFCSLLRMAAVAAMLASASLAFASTDLAVTKTADPAAAVNSGDLLTYTITVINPGPETALNAILTDPLPAYTTFVSAAGPGGWAATTPAVGAGGTVSFANPSFPLGPPAIFTIVVQISDTVPDGTSLVNTATIASDTADPDSGNDSSTATVTAFNNADLGVTKTAIPATDVEAGATLTYTITVINTGGAPVPALNVTLTDPLPPDTTFVSAAAPAGWTAATPVAGAGGTVTFTISSLDFGQSATFTIVVEATVIVPDGTQVANTATVASDTTDLNPGNDSDTATVNAVNNADLSITKSSLPDTTVLAGGTLTYTVTITNGGPAPARNVIFTDPLPVGTTFVSAAGPGGWTPITPAVGAGGTVTFTNPLFLANSLPATFTIIVEVSNTVSDGTPLANTATVTSDTTDLDPGDNSDTATVTAINDVDLSVSKTAMPDTTALAGGLLTYTITVTNNETSDAQNVTMTDPLPAGVTFVSAAGPVGWSATTPAVGVGGTVTFTTPSFGPGSPAIFTITVQVGAAVPNGTVLLNTATVSSTTGDPEPGNNSDTATVTIQSSGAVLIPSICDPGQTDLLVIGTPYNDNIAIGQDSSLVTVKLNGVYLGAFAPTGNIIVYGRAGNDSISAAPAIPLSCFFFGEGGNDSLTSGAGDDVLAGGDGSNVLNGDGGRNILIAGSRVAPFLLGSTLKGNAGGNIMIGGFTAYDDQLPALCLLLAEWRRADADYLTRVAHLRGAQAGGLNGANVLNAGTVFNNARIDYLNGGSGQNWYLAHLRIGVTDFILQKKSNESFDNI